MPGDPVSRVPLARLRRSLAERGFAHASGVPEASGGRVEEATIQVARLLEGERLAWHDVGAAEAWTEPVAFLDGVQRSELAGYSGAAPLVVAEVAAAVRERRERRLRTVALERRRLAVARREVLDAAGDLLEGLEAVAIEEEGPVHPIQELRRAGAAIDRARANLELVVGDRYRTAGGGWLVVDGSLAQSPAWADDPRMVGVSKSHATLPFEGAELERYLRLPAGHRSSIFQPASRSFAPVAAWALRLWPWEGRDVFHGLVRIEVAPSVATPAHADELSRRLLAERAPMSSPDPRWDRLLYGVHAVEQYLKASRRSL
jgi:hypothetical protein